MLVIKNGTLISMAGIYKEKYDVAVENGKIAKVEKEIVPGPEDTVIDAAGKLVTPGFIEPHCHLGIIDADGQDGNEMTGPIHPELRAIDAIDFHCSLFDRALEAGVTTVAVGPGSGNIMGGTFAYLKTAGATLNERIMKEEAALKMALGENPKVSYGKKGQTPSTRMGSAALMRQAFYKAKAYREKWLAHEEKLKNGEESTFTYDLAMHSLMRAFDGMLVKIHAHQANDLCTALRIAREFDLDITLEHVTEGHMIVDELAKENVPLAVGPTFGHASKFELQNKTWETPGVLAKAGCHVSIITDAPVIPLHYLPLCAGLAMKAGMDEYDALRAITIHPAEHIGIADRVGSLEEGKDADIVIMDGSPFTVEGVVKHVFIDGEEI